MVNHLKVIEFRHLSNKNKGFFKTANIAYTKLKLY